MDSTTSLGSLSQCSVTCIVKVLPDVQMEAPGIFPHFLQSNPDLCTRLQYLAEQMFKSPSGPRLPKIPHLCTYSLHITATTIKTPSPLFPQMRESSGFLYSDRADCTCTSWAQNSYDQVYHQIHCGTLQSRSKWAEYHVILRHALCLGGKQLWSC